MVEIAKFPADTLLKLFCVAVRALEVHQHRACGGHVWPFVRTLLASKLQDNHGAVEDRPVALRRLDDLIAARFSDLSLTPRQKEAGSYRALPAAGRTQRGGGPLLMFARNEDHNIPTAKGYYSAVFDPWAMHAATRVPVMKAEFLHDKFYATQPRLFPSAGFVHSAFSNLPSPEQDPFVTEFASGVLGFAEKFLRWMKSEFSAIVPDFIDYALNQSVTLARETQLLAEWLDKLRPRAVMVTCFDFRPSVGMVWAARRAGITVADLGHASIGSSHISYTHWIDVPAGGYATLPDYFFTLDGFSANNIESWMPDGASHRAVAVGRPDLQVTRAQILGNSTVSPLTSLVRDCAKVVLVATQKDVRSGLTPQMLAAMAKAPKDWLWLVRGHPMAVEWNLKSVMPEALETALRDAGIARFETKLATSLPLALILPHVDAVLTNFSGIATDALAYGVRTTFMHSSVETNFMRLVELGLADLAFEPDAVVAALSKDKVSPAEVDRHVYIPQDSARMSQIFSLLTA